MISIRKLQITLEHTACRDVQIIFARGGSNIFERSPNNAEFTHVFLHIKLNEPPRTSLVLLKVQCKDMIAPITQVCSSGHTQYAELLKWTDFLRVLCLLCSQLAVHAFIQKRSKVHFRSNFLSQWSSVTILHPYYPLPVQGFWPLSSPLAWT